jgi:polyphosphate kinase
MANLGQLFPGMTIFQSDLFRVTRNADLALDEDEADDLLVALEIELRRRRFGEALRVEIQSGMSRDFLDLLVEQFELDPSNLYVTDAPLGLHDLWSLYAIDRPDLKGEGWSPVTPKRLLDGDHVGDIFAAIREADILLAPPLRVLHRLGGDVHRPGGRRPTGGGHQADAVSNVRETRRWWARLSARPSAASRSWPWWN